MAKDITPILKKFEKLVIMKVYKSGLGADYHDECINGVMAKISKTLKQGKKIRTKTVGLYVYQEKTDIIRRLSGMRSDSFFVIQKDILDWDELCYLLSKKKIALNKRLTWVRQCLLEEESEVFYEELKDAKKRKGK